MRYDRETLAEKISLLESTDMAVVVSQSQNEVEDLKAKGLDIVPHRQQMLKDNLDEKFKDPNGMVYTVAFSRLFQLFVGKDSRGTRIYDQRILGAAELAKIRQCVSYGLGI